MAALGGGVLAGLFFGLWIWRLAFSDLPPIRDKSELWSLNRPAGATFLDRTGHPIGQRGPKHGQAIALKDLPPYLPKAFLAAEDRRFYWHPGVDPVGIARAGVRDIRARRIVQGGSTLTQQIARTIFLTPEQSLRRKLQEVGLSLRIEHLMSKEEIFTLYLNRIYFGGGAYGVEAASRTYFGKGARDLSLSEAALLAALPKAPTRLTPTNDYQAALKRSHVVLHSLRALGWISEEDEARAILDPPKLVAETPEEGDYGYVLDLAAAEAKALNLKGVPDLIVHLSVDPKLQATATRTVREGVARGKALGATQGAMLTLGPDGAIRALVGGIDHRMSPFDRATQALRQPGSAFKPFVYAAALEQGVTPEEARADAPVNVGGWKPQNAGGTYQGNVTVQDAFAHSINTVAVRLSEEVGRGQVASLARRFGLDTIPPHPAAPVALGAYETTLFDLVSAYQVFQNGGRRGTPYLIESLTDARGHLIWRRTPSAPEPVYDPDRNAKMTGMMQRVIERGTGRKAALDRPAAGKTGTSQNYRDAWFVGFTADYVCGVWMGDDRGRPMQRVAGGDLPAETWKAFMTEAERGLPVRPLVAGPGGGAAPADSRAAFYTWLAERFDHVASGEAEPNPKGDPKLVRPATEKTP